MQTRPKMLTALALASATLAFHASAPAQTMIAMSGIQPNQVFQRQGTAIDAPATIYLTPSQAIPTNYTYYSIQHLNDNGTLGTWIVGGYYDRTKPLQFSTYTNKTQKRVRVSFFEGGTERMRWDSPKFAVGEVFLVAGQSNAANHGHADGALATADANSFHQMVNPLDGTWSPLKEPMPFATSWTKHDPSGQLVVDPERAASPWVSFADKLGAQLNVPVAIVDVAYAGSPVEVWKKGVTVTMGNTTFDKLYDKRLIPGANALGKCNFRSVLWHQGEGNSHRNPNQNLTFFTIRTDYERDLRTVVSTFQADTGCRQPWLVARASYLNDSYWTSTNLQWKWVAETMVRSAQNYLINRSRAANNQMFLAGPDTDLMAGTGSATVWSNHKYRRDGVHFRRHSLSLQGQMWANHVMRAMKLVPDIGAGGYVPTEHAVPEAKAVYDLFVNVLQRTDEQIRLDSEGFRYWVQYLALQNYADYEMASRADAVIKPSLIASPEYKFRALFNSMWANGQITSRKEPTWAETNYYARDLGAQPAANQDAYLNSKIKGDLAAENAQTNQAKKLVFTHFIKTLNRAAPEIDVYSADFTKHEGKSESVLIYDLQQTDEYKIRQAFLLAKSRQPSMAEVASFTQTIANNPSLRTDAIALADAVWATQGSQNQP